jgi:ring-1,2-phenylacetyl-CoA epoxidase subunit PaaE
MQGSGESDVNKAWSITHGRIGRQHLQDALAVSASTPESPPPHTFVCGPPAMTDELSATITELGVPKSYIHFERWW